MLFDAVTGTCVVTLFSRRLVWALALPSINTQSMVRGGAKRISKKKARFILWMISIRSFNSHDVSHKHSKIKNYQLS